MKHRQIFLGTRVAMIAAMGMAALVASNPSAIGVEPAEAPATGSEQAAHLANEKMILSGDADAVKGSSIFDSQKGLFKLSPDGKKLLFYREELTAVNGRKGVLRLVLRDLTDGSEMILPLPALPKRLAQYLPMMSFSNNPFDKTGTRIVMGVGIDTDENGIFDGRTEKMQALVFDSRTSNTKKLSATGSIVTAGYDNTGDQYIVCAIDRGEPEKIRLLLADTDKLNWQEHVLSGYPRAISPTTELIMLLKMSELSARELPSELLLYDTKERKEVARLPAFELEGALSMYTLVFVPQWTTSGGHLYYIDIHGFPDAPRHGTRVWERRSQSVIKELPNLVPIGPGPTKSSMVLMRVDEVKEEGSKVIGIVVHDASSKQTWEIPLPDTRILGTHGSQVIYTSKDKAGKEAVYMAEIVLPKTTPLPE
jgi:hypothetical protein